MRQAALILGLGLAVALSACGKPADQGASKPAATPTPFVANGWTSVFADAPGTVALLDGMGFRLSPYAEQGGAYVAHAQPTPMADPSAKPVNTANLTVTGDTRQLQSLQFALDIVNLSSSPSAKAAFTAWVTRPISLLGADGVEPVTRAIAAETETRGQLNGADYSVTRDPIDGGRRLVVTFTRPAAKPGTSEPRKQ